jgi:hypothetical protein
MNPFPIREGVFCWTPCETSSSVTKRQQVVRAFDVLGSLLCVAARDAQENFFKPEFILP